MSNKDRRKRTMILREIVAYAAAGEKACEEWRRFEEAVPPRALEQIREKLAALRGEFEGTLSLGGYRYAGLELSFLDELVALATQSGLTLADFPCEALATMESFIRRMNGA